MRKRSIIISILCSLALPSGALAESNQAQTPQSIKVEKGNQLISAVDSTINAALVDDFFGPVLEGATVSPTTVTVGETIIITAQVTDDVSGVAVVNAYLNLPNANGYKVVPLELDSTTGEWKGTYTITDLDLEGTWIINFDLYDNAGNYSFGDDMDDTVQVVNPNGGDSEFPTLESATISSSAVGVNEEFTIRAKVNDNNGVDSVFAAIYTADSTGYYYLPLTFDEATGEWIVSHSFSEGDQWGTWYIDIDMFDTAGNFDWVTLEDELSLTNPFSDFTAPSIGEAVLSTTSASPGDNVNLSVPVTDQQSGVSSVYAEFSHIDNPSDVYLQHLTLDQASGEWVGDLNIGSNFKSGIWNVVIHSTDNAGNSGFKEIFGAFDVTNNDGDFDAPVISNVQVTQGEVQVGETVTVTAKVSDNVGVDSVRATLYSQEGSQFIDLSYDEANEQWTGNLLVKESTAPGFYSVSIAAYDTSFNLDFVNAEGGFTVVNPEGDHTGPVISAVAFDKTEVNAGDQITISATVEDVESGVANVTANYYENQSVALTYDSTLGKWVGMITVPTNIPDGEVVNINYINAEDQSGNPTVQFMDGVSFLVHNPDGDFAAPVVESFEMTPTTVKQGETVRFKAKLVDDKSGIKSTAVGLFNSSSLEITSIDLTYDEANDVWIADYAIPTTAELGSYSVSLDVEDNAGNGNSVSDLEDLVIEQYSSPKYKEAVWYYGTKSYYNAVYYAGVAIADGDKRPEVQNLMNQAASALNEAAATLDSAKAVNAYKLLSLTVGVPSDIQAAALEKLKIASGSPKYKEAVWYYNNNSYYNAVYYSGVAIAEGDKRPEVQNLINQAATALFEAAATMDNAKAENAYKLLSVTSGVPSDIQASALAKLGSPKYKEAVWYYSNNSYYNAVYYAGIAIAEGDKRPEVQTLMNQAATALFEAAANMDSAKAGNAYKLLSLTAGVPTDIQASALAKLGSPKYKEAVWYYNNNSYYNAVYYAGVAIAEGDKRPEVQNLMNQAATALFEAAATMDNAKAENAYKLLSVTAGVPSDIQASALAKLGSPKYKEAVWYYNNNSYYNAVYYAGIAIAEGDTRPEVQNIMNQAATALFEAAATMDPVKAEYAYKLLSVTAGVPSDIQATAFEKLNAVN